MILLLNAAPILSTELLEAATACPVSPRLSTSTSIIHAEVIKIILPGDYGTFQM